MSYSLSPNDQELVEQCLGNDRVAQHQLFEKYKDAMYTILVRMLNDESAATDALQETFIAVFKSLPSFRKESTLGAWIKTIAVRAGIAQQRKSPPEPHLDVTALDETEPIVWSDELTSEALEKAIADLPTGYRTSFILIEIEGYSHKEVASMMNISEGTSKSQLYHAKRSLQKTLKDYRYQ